MISTQVRPNLVGRRTYAPRRVSKDIIRRAVFGVVLTSFVTVALVGGPRRGGPA